MPQIQCKVVEKEIRRTSIVEASEPLSAGAGYICSHHPRAVQVRANGRDYDPVRDEADKDIHFQDVAFDPDLGGRADPISEDGINHGRRKSPHFYDLT